MADIPFPTSDNVPFDTQKVIESLVAAQRLPIEGFEENITSYEDEKKIWEDIKEKIKNLEEASRILYSFDNPFSERSAISSDENIVRANAQRNASQGEHNVRVLSLANRDRFRSKELPNDFQVEAGEYIFQVGDDTIKINFRGGSIDNFASAIKARGKKKLKATVVPSRTGYKVFIIEGVELGIEQSLVFKDLALTWALDLELIQPAEGSEKLLLSFEEESISQWEGGPLEPYLIDIKSEQEIQIEPYARFSLSVPPPDSKNRILEFTITATGLPESYYSKPNIEDLVDSTSPAFFKTRTEVNSEQNPITENLVKELAVPEEYNSNLVFFAEVAGSDPIPLPQIPSVGNKSLLSTKKVPEGQIITSILVYNNNPYVQLSIQDLQFTDRDVDGYDPVYPITVASDAEVEIDGVPIFRKENKIDDFLPGIVLDLRRADLEEVVDVTIGPDEELIKNSIIEFVVYYNQVLSTVQIFSSSDSSLIDELEYLTDEEKEELKEQQTKNLLRGEYSLVQIRGDLQNITQRSYANLSAYSLLAEVGVFTSSLTPSRQTPSMAERRGYLQIDEDILETSISTQLEDVRSIFGSDLDGDQAIDAGIAHQITTKMRPYTQLRGGIETKVATLDQQIKREEEKIEKTEKRLVTYEQRLRREYGNMQSTIDSLSSQQKTFDAFNGNNKNR